MAESAQVPDAEARRMRVFQLAFAKDPTLETRSVTKRLTLNAPPSKVYQTLLDAKQLSAVTGSPVVIEPQVAGDFSIGDGFLSGLVTELLENQHLVVACRGDIAGWPENHYSTATFMVKPEGQGTVLTFFQQDVPATARDAVAEGWEEHLWKRLPSAFA